MACYMVVGSDSFNVYGENRYRNRNYVDSKVSKTVDHGLYDIISSLSQYLPQFLYILRFSQCQYTVKYLSHVLDITIFMYWSCTPDLAQYECIHITEAAAMKP